MQERALIVGYGEVGRALAQVLSSVHDVHAIDKNDSARVELKAPVDWHPNVMHICFPYFEGFVKEVQEYKNKYQPGITVIHSTVPVGTTSKLNAVHSPIRGIHPHLAEGIKTFVKFLGGPRAQFVADHFRRAGIKVALCEKSETTELGKLLDTEYYRACIEFVKTAKEQCDKFSVPFSEAYTLFNQSYNEGYFALNHAEFIRPVLQPIMLPIGGHCVMPNKTLLEQSDVN